MSIELARVSIFGCSYRIRVNDFESIMERGMLAIIGSQLYKQDIAALNTNDQRCAHTTSCCLAKALKKNDRILLICGVDQKDAT